MTKVVQLSDDAYRHLTNAKRPGESYSDAVLRVLGGGDLRELAGLRSAETIAEHETAIAAIDELDLPGA